MATHSEPIQISRKLARRSNGFAMDIGGSMVKLVYLSKDEWKDDNPSKDGDKCSETVSLYMTSFSNDDMEEVLEFIRDKVYIRRLESGEPVVIYTTGINTNLVSNKFLTDYNVKIVNSLEFGCFIRAIDFMLRHYHPSQVFIDFPAESFREGIQELRKVVGAVEHVLHMEEMGKFIMDRTQHRILKAYSESILEKLDSGESEANAELHYPYILAQWGSGLAYLKVYEDQSFEVIDLVTLAGRSFIDLGRLLTGAKTYSELMELAAAGYQERLNVRLCDVTARAGDGVYSALTENPVVVYSFGKAHNKDLEEVNKDDLARTLLNELVSNTLKIGVHVMTREKCRDLYLAGSFVMPALTQQIVTRIFETQRAGFGQLGTSELTTSDLRMKILRRAGMLGALGSFLTGCD